MRIYIFLILFFLCGKTLAQQSTDSTVVIDNIIISGNKRTRTDIILREMFLKKGDTISKSKLPEAVDISKHQIFNTTLFSEVTIHTAASVGNNISVIVMVKERWYIFPVPYFRLVDRNFNDWWVNRNHSLERVDYGIKFYHNNLTGRNDKLTADVITGYSRQLSLRYNLPYINKKLTNGINIGIVHTKQKEVTYATNDSNKQLLLKAIDGFPKTYTRADITFTNRPNLFLRHNFKISYTSESIDSFVAFVSPTYYSNHQTTLKYFDISYSLSYSKTNYNAYPTKGFSAVVGGFVRTFNQDNNFYQLNGTAMLATRFNHKWYMRNRVAATVKFPYNGAFINEPLFGYNPYQLRGLEYYVVDGQIGVMHKFTLGYNLLDFNLKVPIKNKYINKVPFKIYAKVYNDLGYCYKPNATTLLNNKLMHTQGFGIDVLTAYDIVFKFEYSFNQLGNSGLFFGLRD
ncbi:MAG: hypothetical protein NTZ59_04665 [Bacteroidetes bacterium]|nr:hypothetical protein [Bacteroidota bacterium]